MGKYYERIGMCGILGGNKPEWNYEAGISAILHRGPDGQSIKKEKAFTMAFARLAIMDLSEKAMQPMTSADQKVSIVFNGEIYGFTILKNELEKKYEFRTTSDTEIILYAYIEYGDRFIDKIDGMFSIAIYDKSLAQVKLFRDRAGIKPLYYFYDGDNFAFSSEIKALCATCENINFELDHTAIYDYLFYQYIPEPKSMYKNIYKLPAAYMLSFDIHSKKIVNREHYWKLKVNSGIDSRRNPLALQENLKYLLEKSVRDQMVADVPVATYLSGGIDSSIITYESNHLKPGTKAFNIGFQEKKYDESNFADILIEKYGLNAKKQILDKRAVENVKGSLRTWYDEPFADTSAYPSYIVASLARQEVTVVLTGDGSDELFGGYSRYSLFNSRVNEYPIKSQTIEKLAQSAMLINILYRKFYEENCLSDLSLCARLLGIGSQYSLNEYRKILGIPKDYDNYWYIRKFYNKELPPITRMRYLDFKTYLPSDILTKVDRTSMAVSLESRVPFLSREIIEFAFSLSQEECCPNGILKGLLKETYRQIIPDIILDRKKRGFSIPPQYLASERKEISVYAGVLKREWPEIWNKIFIKN